MSSYRGKKGYKIPVYIIIDDTQEIADIQDDIEETIFNSLYDSVYVCGFDEPKECTDYLETDIDYMLD